MKSGEWKVESGKFSVFHFPFSTLFRRILEDIAEEVPEHLHGLDLQAFVG